MERGTNGAAPILSTETTCIRILSVPSVGAMRQDKMISMIAGRPTAETDLVVQLPEGNYAAHAIMGMWEMSPWRNEPIVEIMMQEGHKIPIGPDQHITGYQVLAPTFNKALEELISKVRSHRYSNNFKAPPFALSVKAPSPVLSAKGRSMVRLRKLDGAAVLVPAGTRAIPIQQIDPTSPPREERIAMTDKLRSAFDVLAVPIERYIGHLVAYEPTPGAAELHEAIVEVEQGAPGAS